MKRRLRAILVWLLISTLFNAVDAAKAGPFEDFFKTLRSAIAHPKETPRPRRSTHKRKKIPASDALNSQTAKKPTSALPGQPDVRWAKAASIASDQNANVPYGTPVPGQPGLDSLKSPL